MDWKWLFWVIIQNWMRSVGARKCSTYYAFNPTSLGCLQLPYIYLQISMLSSSIRPFSSSLNNCNRLHRDTHQTLPSHHFFTTRISLSCNHEDIHPHHRRSFGNRYSQQSTSSFSCAGGTKALLSCQHMLLVWCCQVWAILPRARRPERGRGSYGEV